MVEWLKWLKTIIRESVPNAGQYMRFLQFTRSGYKVCMAQLTKQTWRKGKSHKMHKRQRAWGGQTEAPEGFEEAGVPYRFGGPNAPPKCTAKKRDGTPCGMIALKGMRVCGAHGGWKVRGIKGEHQPSGRSEAFRASMPVEGASVPLELAQMAVYRQASPQDRVRLAAAWQGVGWRLAVERAKAREGNKSKRLSRVAT